MDRKEFKRLAKKKHIPNFMYNLEETGRDDERFCLIRQEDKWNVYYSERGKKTTDLFFDTESDALAYILKELSE